jgi:hypothetical protein
MRHVSLLVLFALAPIGVGQELKPAALVEQLGDRDFRTREAAGQKLLDLGERALPALEAGLNSPVPEIARRCEDLIPAVVLKVDTETLLAPTMVDLPGGEQTLKTVFDSLKKQCGYDLRIEGGQAVLAEKVKLTGGVMTYWEAVQAVCAAAKVEVQSVDATPGPAVAGKPNSNFNDGRQPGTVWLRASTGTQRATPYKALLVVVGPPSSDDLRRHPATGCPLIVSVFPEPKVPWQRLTDTELVRATDPTGTAIRPPEPDFHFRARLREEMLRSSRLIDVQPDTATRGRLLLSAGASEAATLSGLVRFTVWKPAGELAVVKFTDRTTTGTTDGPCGTRLTATNLGPISNEPGSHTVEVKVRWDAERVRVVQSASGGDAVWFENVNGRLQPVKAALTVRRAATSAHGVGITDSAGESLTLSGGGVRIDTVMHCGRAYTEVSVKYVVKGVPAAVAFHGARVVELTAPFAAKNLPLTAGTGTGTEERVRFKR